MEFASPAIEEANRRASELGVGARLIVDDLTDLQEVRGCYDFLVDYGALDDLSRKGRDLYVQNLLSLTQRGSQLLLRCHEWLPRWWEKSVPFPACEPGEADRRHGAHFRIERIAGTKAPAIWKLLPGFAAYLMTPL